MLSIFFHQFNSLVLFNKLMQRNLKSHRSMISAFLFCAPGHSISTGWADYWRTRLSILSAAMAEFHLTKIWSGASWVPSTIFVLCPLGNAKAAVEVTTQYGSLSPTPCSSKDYLKLNHITQSVIQMSSDRSCGTPWATCFSEEPFRNAQCELLLMQFHSICSSPVSSHRERGSAPASLFSPLRKL